jgi:hypothetical protein
MSHSKKQPHNIGNQRMKRLILILVTCISFTANASSHEKTFKGVYQWGPEVHSFKSCNSKETYWASFDWAGNTMHDFYKKNATKPYQPMYIEFRGQILNEVVEGFAMDYSGLIRISEVKNYTFELPNQCR